MLNDLFVLTKIKEGDVKAFEGIFRLYYSPFASMPQALPETGM